MEPLLFLGRDFLRLMTDSSLGIEERENRQAELMAYLADNRSVSEELLRAFLSLRAGELRQLPVGSVLWFLDWIASSDAELREQVELPALAAVFSASHGDSILVRILELILSLEREREVAAEASVVVRLFRELIAEADEMEVWPRGDLILQTLLTEYLQGKTSTAEILEGCLESVEDEEARDRFERGIAADIAELGLGPETSEEQ